MPRVSQRYRDARRREILEAAGCCFAENGFHSTSIEEVLARLLRTIHELDGREQLARVAVKVWGEALRKPTVAPILTDGITRLLAALERLVRAAQAAGRLRTRATPAQRLPTRYPSRSRVDRSAQ